MSNKIERTLIWFENENERLLQLGGEFFGLSTLLNRLLNEKYEGRKIKFVNIYFSTKEKYLKYPAIPMNHVHYYGGHLSYYGLIDITEFNALSENDKKHLIWKEAYQYLQKAAKATKNKSLLEASEYAYNRGLEIELNPDYRMVENIVSINCQPMKASIWVNFKKDGMYAKLTLENKEKVIFEKEIDNTNNGVEFFLEMYKSIEADGNVLIIKGRKDVDYLPLKVQIDV